MSDPGFRSYGTALADNYAEMALMNFAMEYQSAYEGFYEAKRSFAHGGREAYAKISAAAKGIYDKEYDEKLLNELSDLRNELIGQMEVLTAYTDYFGIHEYILNRIELRFADELPEIDNDEEARQLLQFIFEPKDNMEVNLRIKEMIAQLPVRMTTNRFFDLLRESFTVYKGAERESLNSHVYMIRSAAGLPAKEESAYFPEVRNYIETFSKIDYKNIDEKSYNEYAAELAEVGELLSAASEYVMGTIELLNDLTAYYTVRPYMDSETAVYETVRLPIVETSGLFDAEAENKGNFGAPDIERMTEIFSKLEGRPEKLSAKISGSEGRLESFKDHVDGEDSLLYDALVVAGKLLSTSEFVRIDEASDITEVDVETLNAVYGKLEAELRECFGNCEKLVRRAMMASVLKELPVFFVSHTEVMNYVRFTLDNCKDNAEKAASLRLFRQVYEDKA